MKKLIKIIVVLVLIFLINGCVADTFRGWTEKINPVIDSVNVDTLVYGTDNFETWRTQFNSAVDSINNLP